MRRIAITLLSWVVLAATLTACNTTGGSKPVTEVGGAVPAAAPLVHCPVPIASVAFVSAKDQVYDIGKAPPQDPAETMNLLSLRSGCFRNTSPPEYTVTIRLTRNDVVVSGSKTGDKLLALSFLGLFLVGSDQMWYGDMQLMIVKAGTSTILLQGSVVAKAGWGGSGLQEAISGPEFFPWNDSPRGKIALGSVVDGFNTLVAQLQKK